MCQLELYSHSQWYYEDFSVDWSKNAVLFYVLQEEMMRGKPGYEHLNEPLHILVEAELPVEIVDARLMQAREILEDLLKPIVSIRFTHPCKSYSFPLRACLPHLDQAALMWFPIYFCYIGRIAGFLQETATTRASNTQWYTA